MRGVGDGGGTLTLPGCYLFTDSRRLIWEERHKRNRDAKVNTQAGANFPGGTSASFGGADPGYLLCGRARDDLEVFSAVLLL